MSILRLWLGLADSPQSSPASNRTHVDRLGRTLGPAAFRVVDVVNAMNPLHHTRLPTHVAWKAGVAPRANVTHIYVVADHEPGCHTHVSLGRVAVVEHLHSLIYQLGILSLWRNGFRMGTEELRPVVHLFLGQESPLQESLFQHHEESLVVPRQVLNGMEAL